MDHLPASEDFGRIKQERADEVVDRTRALAATGDEEGGSFRSQAQLSAALVRRIADEGGGAHDGGDTLPCGGAAALCGRESDPGATGDPAVGLARDCVEIDEGQGDALGAGGLGAGSGDEASHGDHVDPRAGVRGSLARDDGPRGAKSVAPVPEEVNKGSGPGPEGIRGDRVEGDAFAREYLVVEGSRGAEETRTSGVVVMSEALGDGEGGEEVAAGAAAGEEKGGHGGGLPVEGSSRGRGAEGGAEGTGDNGGGAGAGA